jgi:hypothetical protein
MAKTVRTTAASTGRGTAKTANGTVSPTSSVRKELVENQMYETAAKLFAHRGFAGTSLQDIADEMGVSRPALYYYVKTRAFRQGSFVRSMHAPRPWPSSVHATGLPGGFTTRTDPVAQSR